MLAGILVGNNLCSGRMEPLVSAGMIELPMSIDQVCDRLGVQTRQGFSELGTRHANSTINEYLSVGTRQDGNIATGSFENTHISAQLIRSYRRRRRTVFDKTDKPPGPLQTPGEGSAGYRSLQILRPSCSRNRNGDERAGFFLCSSASPQSVSNPFRPRSSCRQLGTQICQRAGCTARPQNPAPHSASNRSACGAALFAIPRHPVASGAFLVPIECSRPWHQASICGLSPGPLGRRLFSDLEQCRSKEPDLCESSDYNCQCSGAQEG
jgi:hypothetical protein